MKIPRCLELAITALLLSATTCLAEESLQLGTWKFDAANSSVPIGVGKNETIVYSKRGDEVEAVFDGTNGDGKPKHAVWIGKFDGKTYPIKGTRFYNSVSYQPVDLCTVAIKAYFDNQLAWWGTITISNAGNTRTADYESLDEQGMKIITKKVYHRE